MKLFITGGTGFLGKYLTQELVSQYELVYVLTRKNEIPEFSQYKNIILVKGDVTSPEVIFNQQLKSEIAENATCFIHAAAIYDLIASYETCYLQNILGTKNILEFLKTCKFINTFFYISSIAVLGEGYSNLKNEPLPHREQFNDHYSKTKYFAEKMVREFSFNESVSVRIIRPGIIVGDSKTGEMEKIDGPYYFIKAFKKNAFLLSYLKFIVLSYSPKTKMPIIPVDHCARFIRLLLTRIDRSVKIETYFLISSVTPTISEFLDDLKTINKLNFHFIPVKQNHLYNIILPLLGIPREVIPFMFSTISYDMELTNKIIPEVLEGQYPLYKDTFLKWKR